MTAGILRLGKEELDGVSPEDGRYGADFFVDVFFGPPSTAGASEATADAGAHGGTPRSSVWQHVDVRAESTEQTAEPSMTFTIDSDDDGARNILEGPFQIWNEGFGCHEYLGKPCWSGSRMEIEQNALAPGVTRDHAPSAGAGGSTAHILVTDLTGGRLVLENETAWWDGRRIDLELNSGRMSTAWKIALMLH